MLKICVSVNRHSPHVGKQVCLSFNFISGLKKDPKKKAISGTDWECVMM